MKRFLHFLLLPAVLLATLSLPASGDEAQGGWVIVPFPIYSGRYIDKHVGVLQGEWRYPIAWRFSGTLFGGVGIIGSDLLRTSESSVYAAGGAGLRYRASKTERINLRLDVALGDESSGVYFGLMEAF